MYLHCNAIPVSGITIISPVTIKEVCKSKQSIGIAVGAKQWDIQVKCKLVVHQLNSPFTASMVKMKLAQSAMIVFDS